ncbi:hypothetical protein BJF95_15535 [Rhizobium oryziradicis]|uniref:Uncharacterized protein n=1 Tax=Rhizobium oryziradicis TaxID=1867956 RepID=A0A1Q8ZXB6_9HYPH|nr:hypothetical protein BJF95_15535 [Rhizobium oryziradicis]
MMSLIAFVLNPACATKMALSYRIVLMQNGQVVQCATRGEIYGAPQHVSVYDVWVPSLATFASAGVFASGLERDLRCDDGG